MRILLFSKADILGNINLNRLLKELTPHHEVEVILSDYVFDSERQAPQGDYLVTMERDYPQEVFFPAISNAPAPQTTKRLSFTGLQQYYHLEMPVIDDINAPDVVERVRSWQPDVALSCRYDLLFKDELIGIPSAGFYNLHPGSLPSFRGLWATFWTMLEGKSDACCTFYHIDQGIDTGPVVQQAIVPIDYSRSLFWNTSQVYLGGVEAFLASLPELERGPLPTTPQNESAARYFTSPQEQDFRQFSDRGNHLMLENDYLEILSTYLPEGRKNPLLEQLRDELPTLQPLVAI